MAIQEQQVVECDVCHDVKVCDQSKQGGFFLPDGWEKRRMQMYDKGDPTEIEDKHFCPCCLKVIRELKR